MRSDNIAISVCNLTKTYRLFGHPGDRIRQFLSLGLKQYHREFTALKNVSFDIKKGETVGIIGRNGSGKSTLLQLICGILKPTAGSVRVNGRISALLELGAGFNPEFTGRENVYFQGALMGFTRGQMDERFDAIAAYADIGEFIDQPVRTYSSGMFVRLAFSVAAHVDPDILVVDEALSVGDAAFQARSMRRMHRMLEDGSTLVLVSHDIEMLKSLCHTTVLLDDGHLVSYGPSTRICDTYVRSQLLSSESSIQRSGANLQGRTSTRMGTAKITSVSIDSDGKGTFDYGCAIRLHIALRAESALDGAVVSFYIKDRLQQSVIGSCSAYENLGLGPLAAGESRLVEFQFRNPLRSGHYSITVILAENAGLTPNYYDWVDEACFFESIDPPGQPRWAMTCPEICAQIVR